MEESETSLLEHLGSERDGEVKGKANIIKDLYLGMYVCMYSGMAQRGGREA